MKKLITIVLLLSSFGVMAQSKHRVSVRNNVYYRTTVDTMYTHYPAYYVLVDSITHSLLHFTTEALYVEQSEINTWKQKEGEKYWHRSLMEFGTLQNDYRYFVKGIQIYPIQVKNLSDSNYSTGWSYISTLKNNYKN